MSNHRRVLKTEHFWNVAKKLNPAHSDYRGPSEDLPLLPGEWSYNKAAYEHDLFLMAMAEKNICKLEKNLNPKQSI